jgi:two-component system, cell cycle sensor histidine kinase and response regulator CckA
VSPDRVPPILGSFRATVLLVEQDPGVRRIAERGLSEKGYRVLSAEDRADALKLLTTAQAEIDIVVSNIDLPRGGQTTHYLFTSAQRECDPATDRPPPRTAFLAKPWTIAELENGIRQLLAGSMDTAATPEGSP